MTIFDVLFGAPWWVYAIFIYLIILGVKAIQPQTISLSRLLVTPIIFLAWSIYSLYVRYNSAAIVTIFIISLIVGMYIGWKAFFKGIKFNKNNHTIHIPGSIQPLVLYMLFFVIKYCVGFTYAINPEMKSNLLLWGADVISSGLISGIFCGRLVHIFLLFQQKN